MIADEFDSIKKSLEEIQKEKEREKKKESPPETTVGAVGGLKGSQSLSGVWSNIVRTHNIPNGTISGKVDAQQAPTQTAP